jgi:hypothetical protein
MQQHRPFLWDILSSGCLSGSAQCGRNFVKGLSRLNAVRYIQHLSQANVQEGHSYVLIGENGQCFDCTERLSTALGASKVLTVARRIRSALGLLQINVTWH